MSWEVANNVVMKDAAGKVATMRFSNKITDIPTDGDGADLIIRNYYRDTRPDSFDKGTNFFLLGAEPHIEGHYFCEGTMDVVLALAIEDRQLGWYFQIPAAGGFIHSPMMQLLQTILMRSLVGMSSFHQVITILRLPIWICLGI